MKQIEILAVNKEVYEFTTIRFRHIHCDKIDFTEALFVGITYTFKNRRK